MAPVIRSAAGRDEQNHSCRGVLCAQARCDQCHGSRIADRQSDQGGAVVRDAAEGEAAPAALIWAMAASSAAFDLGGAGREDGFDGGQER